MTHLLPPNLLKLFSPRPPLPYARSLGRPADYVKPKKLSGVAAILAQVKEENEGNIVASGAKGEEEGEAPEEHFTFAEEVRRQIHREDKKKKQVAQFVAAKENYKPSEDPEATGDPYKTLFLSRVSKKATETDIRRAFETYGQIDLIRIVRDKKGRSRGYAFVVYDREKDMKAAYKDAEGLVILGKRLLVDVERGRTVRGWKPRRLGGGLGGRPKPVVDAGGFAGGRGGAFGGGGGGGGGGFRGGRGGGFRGGFGDRGGGGGFRGGPPRGGGFSRGGFGGGGDRFGGSDRGYAGGYAGGGSDRPPYSGGGSFGGPPGPGFSGAPPSGGFADRGGGGFRGRGGGIGYQGSGFNGGGNYPNGSGPDPQLGYGNGPPPAGKREREDGGGYGGGAAAYGGSSPKRMRY